jgi:predicted ATPase
VTITGPGGTGKTRLSLEVAERLVEPFQGAVYFAPLADLSDSNLIADAILDALRLVRSPQREPIEQVVEVLAKQPSLLVLDNFEHLVEGGTKIVQTLLSRVPSLTLLITSRQVLGISAEREYALSPLPTPHGENGGPETLSAYDSVRLFIDRAQQVRPDFHVTSGNAPAVAELVSRLEGIPLAIELAAARAQVLSPVQMLAQLSRRFEFLSSRKRDASERQRTLRGAIDWSYRLLPQELQRFFCRLSCSGAAGAWRRRRQSVRSRSPWTI